MVMHTVFTLSTVTCSLTVQRTIIVKRQHCCIFILFFSVLLTTYKIDCLHK